MPRVHTQKAGKDYPQYGIKKGETYYWWKFRYGGKRYSRTYPKRSQLTQSDFLGQMYEIEDRIADIAAHGCATPEDLQVVRDDIASDLQTLADEQEEKRGNMPDHLQDVGSGEILQNRYDECCNMVSELEGIDLEDFDGNEDDPDEMQEWLDGKYDEISGVSYNGE